MNKRTRLIIRVNEQAGSDAFYEKSQELGILAAQSFKEERGREQLEHHRAQMTGLENIAETTLKVTDVLDYIKKQTARQKGWQKPVGPQGKRFGESLKHVIESGLNPFIDEVCRDFTYTTTEQRKQERQEVYLELVRQFIRQLVVRYEYEVS